jgi:hypothetical protein
MDLFDKSRCDMAPGAWMAAAVASMTPTSTM